MTTAQKLTIAAVKRSLSVGTEFTVEFIGVNAKCAAPGMLRTRRKVVKQTGTMVSEFLDGPKTGTLIYLDWKGLTARQDGREVIITLSENGRAEDFMKISVD